MHHPPGCRRDAALRAAARWAAARAATAAVAVTAVVGLAACGDAARPPAGTGAGHLGDLAVTGAFLPLPPSPAVAAVYLTVHNSGAAADALTGISTPDAQSSVLMTEAGTASMGMMASLPQVAIPAGGQAALTPGHDHAMLQHPTVALRTGGRVPVTLHFARAGSLTIEVPVVPLSAMIQPPGGT